ncbi:hypothetical protein MNB_SV-13-1547 [hydrothermal vent metagenome]|uniref:Uncharacterized protein n=1 Tax=hydrothermal vent metagenome TaxID=652676 RepID=A0A1W1CYK3_9ZZZZ
MPKIKTNKTDKFIEKIGLKYFLRLSSKVKSEKIIKLKDIPSDGVLQVISQNITINAVIIAFLVGALTTVPAVIFEMYYRDNYTPSYYYLILSLITLLLLLIEVSILYWLGMRSVYTLASLTGYESEKEKTLPLEYDVKNMMVRSALELEDPAVEYLGIDPQKYVSKKWLIIRALLYKAKVALTSIITRLIFRKIAMRYGIRVGFIWIAIPITAIWDAIVMNRVIKDAKLRLFGYHLSLYISKEIITDKLLVTYSPSAKEGCIRAISTIMVLAKSYHPNNILLLIRLNQNFAIKEAKDYDNLEKFLEYLNSTSPKERHLLRIISGVSAVFDAELKRGEIDALKKIFGDEYERYMNFTKELKFLLLSGRIHQSASLCERMILQRASK